MKKIFSILALAIFTAVAFTACNDDDNEWVDPNGDPLKVLSNETSFPAVASTGTIVVDATEPVTVTSNDNGWLTTTVNGNTIEVAVEENRKLDGRVATLTIKSGSKKTDVSVIQCGAIFKIDVTEINRNNTATTLTYPIVANLPVTFAASDDWITPSFDEETSTLTVKLAANTTKHMRQGFIAYVCGESSGVIPVKQCVFSTDIVGTYQFLYTNPSNGGRYYVNAKITGTQSNCKLEIPADEVVIPITFNTTDFSITVNAGQQVGTFAYQGSDYLLGTILWDTNAGYLTWSTAAGMTAAVQNGYLNDGSLVTLATFEDNGTWGAYTANALRIELFTGTPFGSATRAQLSLRNMVEPQLLRVDEEAPATTTATSAKGMKMTEAKAVLAAAPVVEYAGNVKIAY